METRTLGPTDLELTPVILGTWALGGWMWGGTARNKPDEAVSTALDAGINCIDTAPVYGFGLSEELVGQAVRGRRDRVLLATKCGLVWNGEGGSPFETTDLDGRPRTVLRCLRKDSILRECDESLRRLGTDVIDLYQCHWPDPDTPLAETMEALLTLRERGKIRWFGVSNFSVSQMEECLRAAEIGSNQVKYSLLSRGIEEDVLPFCREHGVGVLAYSPMEMGLLTGKIGMDHEFPESDVRRSGPWFQPERRKQVLDAVGEMSKIADKYDASPAEISVAWIAAQPGVTAAIAGARNGGQAASAAAAARISLEPEDTAEIRRLFAPLKLDESGA